jgi:hypothetical protein
MRSSAGRARTRPEDNAAPALGETRDAGVLLPTKGVTDVSEETKAKPAYGAGDVPIVLLTTGGQPEELVLRPSYGAFKTLSRRPGGLNGVAQRAGELDVDELARIVAVGAGLESPTKPAPPDLGERIWMTGLAEGKTQQPPIEGETDPHNSIVARCSLYMLVLISGGQRPGPEPAEARDDTADPPPG